MSTRAMKFMHQWLHDKVDEAPTAPLSASDLADQLIAEAGRAGIPVAELEEDAGSVVEMVFMAIDHRLQAD
jgi:hypothetical protein